ncbi:hypothetical protein NW759_009557 [Fusarium solani]|nr:hypothetical protein NW759_009557 [Fusarium solani]
MDTERAELQHWVRISDWVIANASYQHDDLDLCQHQDASQLHLFPTPPASSYVMQRDSSPSKKRKTTAPGTKDGDVFMSPVRQGPGLAEDHDRTPTSHASFNLSTLNYQLPPHPAVSRSTSSRQSQSSASSGRRSTSPAKRTQNLRYLEKPVLYMALEDDANQQLPMDVTSLYDRIYDITVDHYCFLPHQVRSQLNSLTGRKLRDTWFTNDSSQDASPVQTELDALREIERDARECMRRGSCEGAWNVDVHAPLLKLAMAPYTEIRREVVTSARIASPFLPQTDVGVDVESKMIDFALILESLTDSVRAAVSSQPKDRQFINQTPYVSIQHSPIAVSIETKTAGTAEEGRVQLGVWTAAWNKRIRALLRQQADPIVSLPLVLVVEHEWKLFFAYDRGDRLEIIGDMSIGDTKSIIGLYTILAVLRELADWIRATFEPWFRQTLASVTRTE